MRRLKRQLKRSAGTIIFYGGYLVFWGFALSTEYPTRLTLQAVAIYTLVVLASLLTDKLDNAVYAQRPYNRVQQLKLNGGTHTDQEWSRLKASNFDRCFKCQRHESVAGPLTKDHIIPVSQGGTDNIKNIQPLCKACNSAKGATIADYR